MHIFRNTINNVIEYICNLIMPSIQSLDSHRSRAKGKLKIISRFQEASFQFRMKVIADRIRIILASMEFLEKLD